MCVKQQNVVLVDVGDAIQDNQVDVFAKIKILQRSPNSKVLNEMKYDVFVLVTTSLTLG